MVDGIFILASLVREEEEEEEEGEARVEFLGMVLFELAAVEEEARCVVFIVPPTDVSQGHDAGNVGLKWPVVVLVEPVSGSMQVPGEKPLAGP